MSAYKETDIAFTAIALRHLSGVNLLIANRISGLLEGQRTLPGGTREPSQTLEQCALDEITQETGLTVDPSKLLHFPDYHVGIRGKTGRNLRLHMFLSHYDTDMGLPRRVEETKHSDWSWVSFDNIARLMILGEMHPVILWGGLLENALGYSLLDRLPRKESRALEELLFYMYHPDDCIWYADPDVYKRLNTI